MRLLIFMTLSVALLGGVGWFVLNISGVREGAKGGSGVQWVEARKIDSAGLAPDFRVTDRKSDTVQLSQVQKIKIVNFWASWCAPCLEEIPSMARLAKERSDIEVIAISCDSSEKDFLSALRIFPDFAQSPIRLVFDPDKRVMAAYAVQAFPETFILSADNKILRKLTGPVDWQKFNLFE